MPHPPPDRLPPRPAGPNREPGPRKPNWRAIVVALIMLVAAVAGVTVTVDNGGQPDRPAATSTPPADGQAPEVPSEAKVDGPDADGKLDDRLPITPAAAERLEDELEAGQAELAEPLREPNDSPATTTVPGPLAADEVPGCRTRFVGNASSRLGAWPSLIVLHQTVSRERGWSSQDALTGMASRLSSGVSWHLLVGRSEGRCTYTVPLALKAWHAANANPWAIGIEVEAYGDEGSYVTGAGRAKLVSVVRHVARRYRIPLRRGRVDPRTCRPILSGVVEHSDAGACGGGHIDVTHPPRDMAAAIVAAARAGGSSSSSARGYYTASERRWIAEYDRLKARSKDVGRRRVLRRVMCQQRGRVWTAAPNPPRSWGDNNRERRWRSLRARTSAKC